MQKLVIFSVLSILIIGCASPGVPSGGEIDREPPVVQRENPDNMQANINPNVIEVTFDEYIVLKDLQNQLLISPPIEPKPPVTVKNKTLTIDLSRTKLKENTTYVFNFGNAVVDFTEGNPISNYTYVFSTGSYIDSLSISGSALDALTLKKEEGVSIQLYRNLSDTAIYTTKPDYVAKTDEDGRFELNFLAPGEYRLYALVDGNKNYLLNKNEKIGYLSLPVILDSNLTNIELRYFEIPEKIRVTKSEQVSKGVFKFGFNRPVDKELKSISINSGTKGKRTINYHQFFENKDTVYFYTPTVKYNGLDSVIFDIAFDDTTYSIKVNINPELELAKLNLKVKNTRIAPTDSLVIESHSPLKWMTEGRVFIYDKTDSVQVTEFGVEQVYADQFKFYIKSTWQEGHSYQLILTDSMAVDEYGVYYGNNKDTLVKQNFTVKKENETGILNITINLPKKDSLLLGDSPNELQITTTNYIIQLVDTRDNVMEEVVINNNLKQTINLRFTYLTPREYRVKIIRDKNKNNSWDIGAISIFSQPEMVYYYNSTLNVRANWELDEIIITIPKE